MAKFKLDKLDHQILDILIEDTRTAFTDIAKKLNISAGTVHVRVRKMEEAGIITGSTLNLNYDKLEYTFVAYVGIFLRKTSQTKFVVERISGIPNVVEAHIPTGKYNVFCKIRAQDTDQAKRVIYLLDDIDGVYRTETIVSMEECLSDKKRLMHSIFKEL